VLWSRGRTTGVLDWASASIGPAELDFGHFRYNLLGDFGFKVAERFLDVYRAVTGTEPDPFREALDFGPEWATNPQCAAEMDAYVGSLLARLA
jgi:aminoglycoside phosphotransferase (APT) family kinase protein